MRPIIHVLLALQLFVFMPSVSQAADQARKALAKSQYLLRQVNSEKAQLQTKVQALEAEMAELKKSHEIEIKQAKNKQRKLETTLERWQQSHGDLRGSLGNTREVLQQAQRKIAILGDDLAKQTENFGLCYKHNQTLADNNQKLLQQYEQKGVWSAMKQSEPFTGLSRVEVENMVQDQRYHIEDLSLDLNRHLLKPVATEEDELKRLQSIKAKMDAGPSVSDSAESDETQLKASAENKDSA